MRCRPDLDVHDLPVHVRCASHGHIDIRLIKGSPRVCQVVSRNGPVECVLQASFPGSFGYVQICIGQHQILVKVEDNQGIISKPSTQGLATLDSMIR